jgi:hypothetical protein
LRTPRAWRPVIARVTEVDVSDMVRTRVFHTCGIALS